MLAVKFIISGKNKPLTMKLLKFKPNIARKNIYKIPKIRFSISRQNYKLTYQLISIIYISQNAIIVNEIEEL